MKQKLIESEYKRNVFSAYKGVADLGKGKGYYHHLHGALREDTKILYQGSLMCMAALNQTWVNKKCG